MGHFGDLAAGLTHEVEVVVVAEVVDGWSVAHVSVLHHSLVLERLEDPVHGGLGDIGVLGLDGGGEVLGGYMARSGEEGGDDDSALDSGSR